MLKSAIAISPGGRYCASEGADGSVILWDVRVGKQIRTLKGHRGNVKALLFSPDGKRLASGSDDTTILLWDFERFDLVDPPKGKPVPVKYPSLEKKEEAEKELF